MRVPIYAADLSDKRGFKRIAKKLQRNWPSVTPLSLACAQAILSRGLGYRDFHDLQQSAEEGDLHTTLATPNEARDGISTSIFAFCQSNKVTSIDETDLDRLVKLLPLQELLAFQIFAPAKTKDPAAPAFPNPTVNADQKLPNASEETHLNHVGQPVNVDLTVRHSVPAPKLIDKKGLRVIWEVVQRRGNLRDQSLLAMLLQGLRPHDLKLAKPHDFSDFNSGVLMRVRFAKSSSKQGSAFLSDSFGHVVGGYIKEAGLSVNDYLFPSKEDASVPMSSQEMSRIIGSYLREALTDPAQRSVHRIRQSVIANTMRASAISVSDLMGHSSPPTTLDYVSGLRKKPKE